jgi:flagellar basal-body rod modification protein FlgD
MSASATDVYSSLGIASTDPSRRPARSSELGQDTFLMLMTEQLKNQDPLKPMESNEFLGQLAQFSTVSGIEKMQSGLNALASAFENSQALQAASLVGRSALVAADSFEFQADSMIEGSVEVPAAGEITVTIKDASGQIVSTQSIQADGPGAQSFSWDGRSNSGEVLPPGRYSISASYGSGDSATALTPMLAAEIQSVSYSTQGILLNLTGIGSVPLSAVGRIS